MSLIKILSSISDKHYPYSKTLKRLKYFMHATFSKITEIAPATPAQTRPYDLLIFDWDGTIMDSTHTIATCIQAACLAVGEAEPPLELAKHVIGLGLRDALLLCAPQLPQEKYPALAKHYHEHFLDQAKHLQLFDTVQEQLNRFIHAGYLLAVATGKNRRGLNEVLNYTQLGALFTATRTPDESPAKPAPGMILDIITELNIPAHRTLMIGDTTHDIHMAHNAGVASFAVTQGAHDREKLLTSHPTFLATHISELSGWLQTV
jgi:phosphoglycolate phosphatase